MVSNVSSGLLKNIALINGAFKLIEYQEKFEKKSIGDSDITKISNYNDYKAVISHRKRFIESLRVYLSQTTKGLKIDIKRLNPKLKKIDKVITTHLMNRYCDVEMILLQVFEEKIKHDKHFNPVTVEFLEEYKNAISKAYKSNFEGIFCKIESLGIAKAILRDLG